MRRSLRSYGKCPALAQPFGRDLFAHTPASSLGCVSTYTPSFFLGLGANSYRRGIFAI